MTSKRSTLHANKNKTIRASSTKTILELSDGGEEEGEGLTSELASIYESKDYFSEKYEYINLEGKSLNCFTSDNKFRVFLRDLLATGGIFEIIIQLVILTQTVLILFEDPLQDPALAKQKGSYVYYIGEVQDAITYIFIVEMAIKLVVYGLIFNGPNSYLKIGWNILDFVIVTISIISIIVPAIQEAKGIKIIRVLRILRILSREEGLRHCVLGILYSFPGIIRAILVVIGYALLFNLLFISMLRGKFYSCTLPEPLFGSIQEEQVINKYDCLNLGGQWLNSDMSFDNMGEALLAFLAMLTKEGWVEFMIKAVDTVEVGMEPKRNTSGVFYFVFLVYIIFISQFLANLFIEVTIATYDRQRKIIDRDSNLTEFQHEWINIQLLCYKCSPAVKVKGKDSI